VFYVESDVQVAMPYLQSIGSPVVSLSVACKSGAFKLYEDNTLDVPSTHVGDTIYTANAIADKLFNQSTHINIPLTIVLDSERILTAPYAPTNLPTYLLSNNSLLGLIYRKSLPPSLPKALASLPSSPTKSISSILSRSPKRRNRDTIDSVRCSVFDSPGTPSQSTSETSRSRSSVDEGLVLSKRMSMMFLAGDGKEHGVVTGVRSFVEGIREKGWPGMRPMTRGTDGRG
jgi:hypothetical protein